MSGHRELLREDSPRWLEALTRLPHDFYHLPSYGRLEARRLDGQSRAFLFTEDHAVWLLPLIVRPIPDSPYRDAISAYGYPGPLVDSGDDDAFCGRAVAAMVEELSARGLVSAFIRTHPLLSPTDRLGPTGALVHHGETVVIDLEQSEDEMWHQVRRDHRNQINRARRSDWTVSIDADWLRLDDFLEVYHQSMERVGASPGYFFEPEYFRDLYQALGGHMFLCTVEDGERTMCAGLFSRVGDIVQFHLSGTHDDYLRQRPSKLMLDAMRRWAKQRGAKRFHLGGGVGAQRDSLYEFKAGFSKISVPFHTWRLILDPAGYRELCAAAGQSPEEGAAGFFPAYRSPAT